MANFKSFQDLAVFLMNEATDVYEEIMADAIKEELQDRIQEKIYDKYSPSHYRRRGENGGLLDKDNMIVDVVHHGETILLNITNITPPSNPKDKQLDSDKSLLENLEDGYGSKSYAWNQPRPLGKFTEWHFIRSDKYKELLANGLEKKKFRVKIG